MTDANQQTFSSGTAAESIAARHSKTLRQRIPAPLWRFRPTLPAGQRRQNHQDSDHPKIVLALRKTPKAAEIKRPGEFDRRRAVREFRAGPRRQRPLRPCREPDRPGRIGGGYLPRSVGADRTAPRHPLGIRCYRFCHCDAGREPPASESCGGWAKDFQMRAVMAVANRFS